MDVRWWWTMALAGALAMVGCPAGDDDDTGDDDDDSDSGIALVETHPADGSTGPYYRDCLEATFDAAVPDATIELGGPGGVVAGDLQVDGAAVGFCPVSPLDCETDYTATARWDGGLGSGSWSFATDELGCVVDGSPVGNVYAVDLAEVDITEPSGIGTLVGVFMTAEVLLQVESAGGGEIQMLGGMATESGPLAQDACVPTFSPTQGQPGLWDDPWFLFEADDLEFLFMDEHTISIERLVMSGTLTPDLTAFREGRFEAVLDVRSVAGIPAVADLFGDTDICEFLGETMAVDCQPCGDGVPQCVYFLAEQIDAPRADGVSLVPITAGDVAGDPACAD